ncbi:hypothetical protein V6Z12_A05G019700 [Gossypium hirsutum]
MENPCSLLARLLKTKYYKEVNCLEASLGTNPSFVWKSIWCAKGLLGSGLKWRIGSGLSVSIWKDYWVTGLERVADLILNEPNRWNRDLIYSTFSVDEADQIMSLLIPTTDQSDKKFVKNYVPSFQNLHFRRLLSDNICPRYCVLAAQVWSNLEVKWLSSMANSNFNEWLNWLLENSDRNKKGLIVVTIWALWLSRNKLVHERMTQSLEEIVTFIRGFGLEYRSCAENLKHPQPRSMVRWMAPPQGWVKINVDAGVSVAKKRAVSGFIIRNDEGFIMGSGFQEHYLVQSVVMAKALAVLHRLQFALNLGFPKVILESDSRLVVNNIQQTCEDYWETRPFTWDVKNLARKFRFCRFQFIAREGNGAAHAMAVEGMRIGGDMFWVEEVPLKAMEVADFDRQNSRSP